jgi:hypothetical protein
MLDCRDVSTLRLRFPHRQQADIVLGPGLHSIGRDAAGQPVSVDQADDAIAQFCVDRRGVWLKVREGTRGLHVNGRPTRRIAMMRAGDAIFIDGHQWLLLGETPPNAPPPAPPSADDAASDPRMVLRGVGGAHHGRSITLDQPRLVGRLPECGIRIDEAAFADRHARLEPHPLGVVLRDLGSEDGSVVNGWPVRHALLRPGDQVVFDAHHRFVVEAPRRNGAAEDRAPDIGLAEEGEPVMAGDRMASARRVPWLLLAALLLAASLSLLLLYGAR